MKKTIVNIHLIVLVIIVIATAIAIPMEMFKANEGMLVNFAIANYAHGKAGGEIAFEPDYVYDKPRPSWAVLNNSYWLFEWMTKIVPTLVYEDISVGNGNYPISVGFLPLMADRSFHVGGFAQPNYMTVWLNDRYVTDENWNDEREAFSTLVHELIHIQGGSYLLGASTEFEPKTQAATMEALAGMCNQGTQLACKSFWFEVEGYAKVAFKMELISRKAGFLYDVIADALWRDSVQERAAEKSLRYWAGNPDELSYIYQAYYQTPWEIIKDGFLHDMELDTGLGFPITSTPWIKNIQGMPFDDTKAMFGPLVWILNLIGF